MKTNYKLIGAIVYAIIYAVVIIGLMCWGWDGNKLAWFVAINMTCCNIIIASNYEGFETWIKDVISEEEAD